MLRRFATGMECPLSEREQNWIDERWEWLSGQFGREFPRERPVMLPTSEYFPIAFPTSPAIIDSVFESVCRYMNIDPAGVVLEMADLEETIGGLYSELPDGRFLIRIANRNRDDLQAFVGTAAHELAHIHLLGHRRLTHETEDHELVTDLLPIFFGMGVFAANSVIYEKNTTQMWLAGKRGYMSMAMHSYALAKLAHSRNEPSPKWAKSLRPDVRAELRRFNSVLFGKSSIVDLPEETEDEGVTPAVENPETDAENETVQPPAKSMDVSELLSLYAQGVRDFRDVEFPNLQLESEALPGCDFSDCDFPRSVCDGVDFSDCNFTGVNFREASLENAVFQRCDMKEAIFTEANLNGADFAGSDLSDADFRGAQLIGTKLLGTKRTVATDFRFADISQLVSDGDIAAEVKRTERHADGGSKWGDFAQQLVFSFVIATCSAVLATSLINLLKPPFISTSLVGVVVFLFVLIFRTLRKI